MCKPNNYLWPATAFHYPARPGKGELKGLFRNPGRQKAGYISSEPQLLLCSLRPLESLCLPAVISAGCICIVLKTDC